jgi:hypothetical protein
MSGKSSPGALPPRLTTGASKRTTDLADLADQHSHHIRYEWRVTWRRAAWWPSTSDKSRIFCSEIAARRFVDHRLAGVDRPDLSPITVLCVDRRHVGTWNRPDDRRLRPRVCPPGRTYRWQWP